MTTIQGAPANIKSYKGPISVIPATLPKKNGVKSCEVNFYYSDSALVKPRKLNI
jgi:hypothetical protein